MRKFTSALLLATTLLASFAAFATTDDKKPLTPNDVAAEETPAAEKTDEELPAKK